MKERQFPAGTVIFKEGDPSDYAYVIQSGQVEILKKATHGDLSLATLGPGDVFGEMGLFDNNPRSASARAVETTNVEMLDVEALNVQLEQCPTPLRHIVSAVFDRLRTANQRISEKEKATDIIECDFQTIQISAPEGSACEIEPAIIPVAQLPFRICGYPRDKMPKLEGADILNIPCDGPPLHVSRNHCEFILEEGAVFVRDLGSRYCTTVGRDQMGRGKGKYRIPLQKGQVQISFGDYNSPYTLLVNCE